MSKQTTKPQTTKPAKPKYTVFVDSIGRYIIGKETKASSNDVLAVIDPAIIHVQPNTQTGQLTVQVVPYFFKEFVTSADPAWEFPKNSIVLPVNLDLDDRLTTQYNKIYNSQQASSDKAPPETSDEVIKLFDD